MVGRGLLAGLLVVVAIASTAPSASAAPPTRTLTVTRTGTGTGTVTSSPAGINCGATCSAKFATGSSVTLTATPATGSTFSGWSGGGCSGTGTCAVTMSANTTVSAAFTVPTYGLSVTKSGTGTGTVTSSPAGINCGATCSANFASGTSVTLTATPSAGSAFAGWSGACTGTGTCVATMTAARSVTATFNLAPRSLSISKSGNGAGTVTSSPAGISCGATCSANFANGTSVTLTATPATGSTFAGWSGGGCSGTGTCIVVMSADVSVTANFALIPRTLSVAANGAGSGTVSSVPAGIDCGVTCSTQFDDGTPVGLVATPVTGSTFAGWSGDCSGTGICNLVMDADRSVTATFTPIQRTLTIAKSGTGLGTVSSSPVGIECGATCSAQFDDGATLALTATPDPGSTFAGWSGACTGTATCNLTLTGDANLTATFIVNPQTLSVSKTGTGDGTITSSPALINCGPTCSAQFNNGTTVTLTAAAATGSTFAGWSGAGCSGTGTCTVSMSADKAVSATFTAIARNLSVSRSGSGSGTVSSNITGINCGATCSAQFNHGTAVTLTATPDPGSTFAGWTGGCSGTGACNLTMDANKSVGASFVTIPRHVVVALGGAGAGTVASTPSGISCGTGCDFYFENGTAVTLTATPAAGSTFTGWSGGGCSGTGTCSLNMTSDVALTATFALVPRTISVTRAGAGAGTVSSVPAGISCGSTCSAQFDSGTGIVLMANPSTGSTFLGWSGDCTGTGVCALTMDVDHSVTATFAGPNQPDAAVKSTKASSYLGEGILNTTGVGQTVSMRVKKGKSLSFDVQLTNRGAQAEMFTLQASKGNQRPFSVKYFFGAADVTTSVVTGTFTTTSMGVGETAAIKVVVKASRRAKTGVTKKWLLTATSTADGTAQDTVGISAKAR